MMYTTKLGMLRETSDCAPSNGFFLIPVYDTVMNVNYISYLMALYRENILSR